MCGKAGRDDAGSIQAIWKHAVFVTLRRLVGYPWRLAGTSGRLGIRIRAVTGECPRAGGEQKGHGRPEGGEVNNEARVKMWRDEGNGAGGQGVRKHNGSKSGA